ncbi:DUF5067 domain-containing protein [Lactococcus formosensis]|uniref:DUF5067 domain-containing protein n=1 Tax=Lactococcus formosensis TaxID=1281486 RepID=UPI003266134D
MKKLFLLGATTLALFSLAACSSDNSEKTASSEKATTEKKVEPKKEETGWDAATKTFTSKEGILKIDKTEKTTDYDGKPALKVYFTLTNKGEEPQVAQILFQQLARVQQKSKNTSNDLQYAMISLENVEEDHLQDNINPNGTVSGYYSFELENDTDPVQILFQKDFQTVDKHEITLK